MSYLPSPCAGVGSRGARCGVRLLRRSPRGGTTGPREEEMIAELNTRVHRQLTHLVQELTERIPARLGNDQDHAAYNSTVDEQRRVQRRISYLRRVAAGLSFVQGEALSEELIGFGSTVRVQDLQSGEILS